MSFTVQRLLKKAGVELLPGKNHPKLTGKGARVGETINKLIMGLHDLSEQLSEQDEKRAAERAELAAANAKLANEKAELIKELAIARFELKKHETCERLEDHGLSREDSKRLTSNEDN